MHSRLKVTDPQHRLFMIHQLEMPLGESLVTRQLNGVIYLDSILLFNLEDIFFIFGDITLSCFYGKHIKFQLAVIPYIFYNVLLSSEETLHYLTGWISS